MQNIKYRNIESLEYKDIKIIIKYVTDLTPVHDLQ